MDKARFEHDMPCGDFEDLPRRTAFSKVLRALRDKAINIAKNPKYDKYRRKLASVVYKYFDKKFSGGAVTYANKSAIKSEPKSEYAALSFFKTT